MSNPHGGRFTTASLLAAVEATPPAPPNPQALAELLSWFRSECAVIVRDVPAEVLPLRLPKGRIDDLLTCERGTLARLGASVTSEATVRGRLTDLLVAQQVHVGVTCDVEGDLRDALDATADTETLAWLDDAGDEVRARLWAHAATARANLQNSWGELPRRWWPRTQERVSVEVADGVLVLAAQFDVVAGGPPTAFPMVILEVKAGAATDRHRRDLLWYALLAALRHDQLPAMVAVWTAADDGLVPVPVSLGTVESAARRGLAALEHLAELAAGRAPTVTANRGCGWCPVLDRCEPGLAWVARTAPSVPANASAAEADDDPEWDPGSDEGSWL